MNNYITDRTFQLLRTNVLLSSNYQVVVDSNNRLFLESINSDRYLNNKKYKKYKITKNSQLEFDIVKFYDSLPLNIVFSVKNDFDNDVVYDNYEHQYDKLYWCGAADISENKLYDEQFEYFAPLYFKNDIPTNFIILRVEDPVTYECGDNTYYISSLDSKNFKREIIDKWKCVKVFDLTKNSDIGYWLYKNYVDNERFPIAPLEIDFRKNNLINFYGIDYEKGGYTSKSVYVDDKFYLETPHYRMEKFITENFKNNSLIFPNIINLKFLFDDICATPFNKKEYTFNRYYGFYVDLEHVKTLTPYRSYSIKENLVINNNIFYSDYNFDVSVNPFLFDDNEWNDNEKYYIYALNDLYEVIRIKKDDEYLYKIISDKNISIEDINRNYEIDIIFKYDENEYVNYIEPRTQMTLDIDKYVSDDDFTNLYAHLYLIEIDNKFHVLEEKVDKYTGVNKLFIRTDYAISCDHNELKYYIIDENDKQYSVKKNIFEKNQKPITFKIFRVKFRDIKDFDFNRVVTDFANFDFEKNSEYVETTEHKLYAIEHRDASDKQAFKHYEKESVYSGKIINTSSEYISSDELFEINVNGLSDIWTKNSCICKWCFVGSISHSDYPYKFNNSYKIGSVFNRTTDVFSRMPNVMTKTSEFFYRIGNFYNTYIQQYKIKVNYEYFDNQTLSIQNKDINEIYFNLDEYIRNDFDYFDFFFANKHNINKNEYISRKQYAVANGGDKYRNSSVLFKGIKYNIYAIKDIIRDRNGYIIDFIYDYSKNFNNYKFAVILNEKYTYMPQNIHSDYIHDFKLTKVYTSNSNILDDDNGIHIFLNEKYKNILVIINIKIKSNNVSYLTFNNSYFFDYREGLYYNILKDTNDNAFEEYNNLLLVAHNYINALNNYNEKIYDNFVKYYYINEYNEFGYGRINVGVQDNTFLSMQHYNKNNTPFVINCEYPVELKLKKRSFSVAGYKGPIYNIYDKYNNNDDILDKEVINEPLGRIIEVDEEVINENNSVSLNVTEKSNITNTIYRYNGFYEPIFKNINIFNNKKYNILYGLFIQKKNMPLISKINSFSSIDQYINYIENEIINVNNAIEYINDLIQTLNKIYSSYQNIQDDLIVKDAFLSKSNFYNELLNYNLNKLQYLNNILEQLNQNQQLNTNYCWIINDYSKPVSDSNYISCEMYIDSGITHEISSILEINSFNFNIPHDAIIKGVKVKIKRRSGYGYLFENIQIPMPVAATSDYLVCIKRNDGVISENKAVISDNNIQNTGNSAICWNTAIHTASYGGDNDLWSLTLTPNDFNNNNFSIIIQTKTIKKENLQLTNVNYIYGVEVQVYYTIKDIPIGLRKTYLIDSNTMFDTEQKNFGIADEIVFSKVNENENILKIKENVSGDRSVFPMVDEFGYTYDDFFIFSSTWDPKYHVKTKNELK